MKVIEALEEILDLLKTGRIQVAREKLNALIVALRAHA